MLKRQKHILFLLLGIVVFGALAWLIEVRNIKTTSELVHNAEKKLHQKELLAKDRLRLLTHFLKDTPPEKLFSLYEGSITDLYKREGIVILAYKNDSLCFWSDNHAAVDLNAYTNENDIQVIRLRNGWFEFIRQKDSLNPEYSGAALIAIKQQFDIENKYLLNRFEPWLGLPDNADIKIPVTYLPHTVKSYTGLPLFEVVNDNGMDHSKNLELLSFLCAIIALSLVIVTLVYVLRPLIGDEEAYLMFVAVMVLSLRTMMIALHWPGAFYNTMLFDPSRFADANSFFFSSLGDVLINSILMFAMSVMVYRRVEVSRLPGTIRPWIIYVWAILVCYFAMHITLLVKSLVINSTISYSISDLFNLSWYSIVAFFSVCLLFFALYVFVEKMVISILYQVSLRRVMIGVLLCFATYALLMYHYSKWNIYETCWPFVFILISFLLRRYKASYNFINVGLLVVVGAVTTSYLFFTYEKLNKLEKYQAISYKLSDKQDIIAENEFEKVGRNIKTDSRLRNLISLLPLSADQTEQRIRQIDFSGYFDRYDIVLSLFDKSCTPYFKASKPEYMDEDYFKQQIDSNGIQTVSDDLFFIENKAHQKVRYIARISLGDVESSDRQFTLYAQFEPKQVSDLGSFPDLLIARSLQNQLNLGNISYALYNNGRLITKYGSYNYTLFSNKEYINNSTPGFRHYIFRNEPQTTVVITEKEEGPWSRFTSMSYFFVFFSAIVLLVIFVNNVLDNRRIFIRSLNTRIQFILVTIVVLSLAGVVIGTVWVVSSQSAEKNKKDLLSKAQSVLNELRQSIGQLDKLDAGYKDYTAYSLKHLANLFGSDISLYDSEGRLFSTSRSSIYEQGMVSRFMNPMAFSSFVRQDLADYTLWENIGQLNYLSAYIPFYNNNDQLIGYLNLPYFSRQKDLEQELTAYLTTLINIYTILFAFTTLVALLVSNYLTKPLRLIKQQISKIGFGKYNARLEWNTKDEIGDLVDEYNDMLLKLEESSQLLARSERESAWREMAKQVAHEIKNPLTPMKLNIQHLQRVIDNNPEDIRDHVHKVARLLIEQIDTLTHIANEFSNFAKLPKANIEAVNVSEVLNNVVELFKQDKDMHMTLDVHHTLTVLADKEQLIRVFTNLLKNAEQSVPEGRKGQIRIASVTDGEQVVISVTDNGVGISEEHKGRIFTPNFTTKSAGTGLGLAMVKNIITSFNGTIWFDTIVNEGSTFYIRLPLASNKA